MLKDTEIMKKFYELLRRLLMEIDDIYDENEKLILEDYLRIEILELLKEGGIELDCINSFPRVELKRLGLLEVRPNLEREISSNIFQIPLEEISNDIENNDTRRNSIYEETGRITHEDKAIKD
jgi:hypothetical protein